MNGTSVLASSLGFAHQLTSAVVGDCSPETLARRVDGTIESAGSILAHAVISEDFFIQSMMQGEPLLYKSGGFASSLNLGDIERPVQTPEWAATIKLDMSTFTPYMQAVFAATDAFVAGLSETDLDREVQGPTGKQPIGAFLAGIGVFHLSEHLCEIAAIKGVQGLKGLPF